MLWKHADECSHSFFEFSQTFTSVPHFFFSFRKHCDEKKRKTTCLLLLSKCKFSLLAPQLHQQLVLVQRFYRIIKTLLLLTNQRAYFLGLFSNIN